MMERGELDESERSNSNEEELRSETHESDNAWLFKSVPEEELHKWRTEKERYDEVIEYIKEVDEILNLMKPFPRDENVEKHGETPIRSDSQTQSSRYGLDHLENIIKLVQQLKELQENSSKFSESTCFVKDLKKLREHKRRLKNEEIELRTRARAKSTPEESSDLCPINRKCSSTSEKLETEPRDGWQDKRKSLSSLEGKSKVSKWTKVKEAFHWERTSALKDNDKETYGSPEEKSVEGFVGESREHSPDDGFSMSALDGFSPPPPPPPPPPQVPLRPDHFLSVGRVQDLPSSSSSDRLDEFLSFSEIVTKGTKSGDPDSPSSIHPFAIDDIEEVENVPRKSSSDELVLAQIPQHLCKEEYTGPRSGKSNKTTWGKVKDIIQTRKDSLKKKPKKRGSDEFKKRRKLSNPQFSDHFEDLSSPEEKVKNAEIIPKISYDFPDDPPQSLIEEKCCKILTPALTVTLPSTEELRSFSFEDMEKKEVVEEDKSSILSQLSCQAHYCEDKSKFGKSKSGQNQRLSRWIKVKRVFLTSASPPRVPHYLPVNNSSPTSQNKSSGFFSDLESDELSSGEWIDDKSPSQERQRPGYPDPQSTSMALIQEDIRKSYNELQKKLSQEFDQKLKDWEMKNESSIKQEEPSLKTRGDEGDCIPKFRKSRDSIAVPLPSLNDLSPEFKKKLNDWKKMKTSQSSSSVSSSTTKEEIQGQNIKIRIGEWQPWKTRCSQKATTKCEGLPDDYSKKSEEKGGSSRPPANRRKDDEGGSAYSTTRRGSKRRDSVKKLSQSRTSSGGESLVSTSSTDKDGRFIRRSQKLKDFQWVEKELQKIEREKLRLEQEKEKYLEREARLEKMKRTMGTTCPTQEVLVRTPEGFFRFKGISQKFTKKLYEWEKARGIAPEASTFALLEESAKTRVNGDPEGEGGVALQRSKSTGSVPELSSTLLIQTMAHHPSSLSLNDVDELKTRDEDILDESISSEQIKEPEAIIVDVEDIIEETALLAESLDFKREKPVYTYALEENNSVESARVIEDKQCKFTVDNAPVLDDEHDASITFRGTSLNLDSNEPQEFEKKKVTDNINTNPEDILMSEDATSLKDAKEVRHTLVEDLSQREQNRKHHSPITEDKSRLKREQTETVSPYFSPWVETPCNTRHLYFENSVQGRSDPEALKKKIKEKITLMQRMSTETNWKHFDYDCSKNTNLEEEKRVGDEEKKDEGRLEPVSLFVPTTRKIISPVKTTQGATPSVCSYVIDDVKTEENESDNKLFTSKSASPIRQTKKNELEMAVKRDIGMPPLPNSPKCIKKLNPKETAPSIRMIIAKYNQKISEHDNAAEKRTESGSPIWRSPVFGRRTQEKIDKFVKKDEEGRRNGEVQKSASLDNMRSKKSPTPPQERDIKGILKSSSVGVMKTRPQNPEPLGNTLPIDVNHETSKETSPSVLRALRIQKAKEEFLSGRSGESSDASTTSTIETPSTQIRLVQTETEPEQNLIKSVSAETIGGESSLGEKMQDRPLQKSPSKFDISSIKSKFRKIRMRKEKDPKLNAVAVLCRQSLLIEVPKASESLAMSKSCPSSPVMDRNKPPHPNPQPKK